MSAISAVCDVVVGYTAVPVGAVLCATRWSGGGCVACRSAVSELICHCLKVLAVMRSHFGGAGANAGSCAVSASILCKKPSGEADALESGRCLLSLNDSNQTRL